MTIQSNYSQLNKAVHIASFCGNLGDLVNHQGFYSIFDDLIEEGRSYKVEMRDFYSSAYNKREFNSELLETINDSDLLILGGGAYFDVRWQYSATGTTLDMSKDFIDRIKVPVLVNAMGYHEFPGLTTSELCDKFYHFLSDAMRRNNWFITVRNDGSLERMENRYGEAIADQIIKVPDNGFSFTPVKDYIDVGTRDHNSRPFIGMCITNDLFAPEYNGIITPEVFNCVISRLIVRIIENGYSVIMFPHTRSDLLIIEKILSHIPNRYQQKHIVVAPMDTINTIAPSVLSWYYARCKLVIGMRFHSLVLSIDNHVPAIALAGHEQIEALYKELHLDDYCIRANTDNFDDKILDLIEKNQAIIIAQNNGIRKLISQTKIYHDAVNELLRSAQ